jgi:hypothetical protein
MKTEQQLKVGIRDRLGDIVATVSLDDLISTGDSYQLYLMNGGRIGSSEYELTVENEEQLAEKIRLGQLKREGVAA